MAIVLYDLAGRDDRRFSPNCWRVRMAIAHKGLECETRPTRFSDVRSILDGTHTSIPVIQDGDTVVSDSWAIANYLEDRYPDRPSLFGGEAGRVLTHFFNAWANRVLHVGIAPLVVLDIYEHLDEIDKAYFRASREARFGRTLEEVQSHRDAGRRDLRSAAAPLRDLVSGQAFVCGGAPAYADYVAFGAFQWARTISDFPILDRDDPVYDWFQRCLGLFDGLGRRNPGYDQA